ncbi:hypothetical protein L226DRAFT_614116 [Lentinus tigrinus ALCF2SS1-7]|uniref:F-box domain-containing protein n=1 Tax=Lentinus tigrinus ALCF2SS1-6 TaxID=1328759 RepID=A0A5C2S6C4_9APHY|nr:hypothetical protein L227DRAFT_601591 [Lentinus tigrinus ALCF2SS1-6]RPD73619.1 hypothetical protein L226DRAFT_614116 [Lentinus tigrinus ALCF2SS1-7]
MAQRDDFAYYADGSSPFPTFDSHLTPDDRSHLASLDPKQVHETTRIKIDELLNRVRSLSSVCNAAAPINRILPPDVLMGVFSYLEPSFRRPVMLNVLHVCRLWRHLLLRSTAFWGRVAGGFRDPTKIRPDGVALFHTTLQRTHNTPLTITLDYVNSAITKTLVLHASHIVSLTITVTPEGLNIFNGRFEQEGMPLLERLDISHSTKGEASLCPNLLLKKTLFPRLRFLRHPFDTLEVTSIDGQLRDLVLFGCECPLCAHFTPSRKEDVFARLTQLLERCTSLQSLVLNRIAPTLHLQTTDDRTISLPTLRYLSIVHHYTSVLLSSLIIPEACVVVILGMDATSMRIDNLFPRNPEAFRQLSFADRVRARFIKKPKKCLLQVFESYIGRSNVFFVSKDVRDRSWSNASMAYYRSLLRSMPRLRFIDFPEDARRMAIVLSKVTSGGCVCPHLEELEVQWQHWCDEDFKGWGTDSVGTSTLPGEDPWYWSGPMVLSIFCSYMRGMLSSRAAAGSPLKRLHLRMYRGFESAEYVDEESWELPVLKERILAQLGSDFECDLVISYCEDDYC